jgi:dolichol kinase
MAAALLFPSTIMETGIATFVLCFGDGLAALIGSNARHKIFIRKGKSLNGTIACFVGAAFGLVLFSLLMTYKITPLVILVLSAETAVLELVGCGLDNFSILYGVYLTACLLTHIGG